jgi:hypothetical protein
VAFDFDDGVELVDDRAISTVHDSVGEPLMLSMLATEKSGGRALWHTIVVAFSTSQPDEGLEVIRPAGTPATGFQRNQQLSAASLAKARTLSKWLWNHRCRHMG